MVSQPPRALRLSRQQISKIVGGDFEAIRAFERLLSIGETAEDTGSAVRQLAELAATEPPGMADTETPTFTSVDFGRFAPFVPSRGRLGWSPFCDTLGLGIGAAGVMLRVGMDTLACVVNNSGTTIARGAVVRITGASGSNLQVAPFIANGSQAPFGVIGLLSQTLANGAEGYATTYGIVPGLDTSSFALGAVVYASASVAGGLTATAPTSPNVVLPVGVVVAVSATEGQIMARCDGSAGLHLAAVTAPAGGGTVDTEARTAINALIARLRQAGITL